MLRQSHPLQLSMQLPVLTGLATITMINHSGGHAKSRTPELGQGQAPSQVHCRYGQVHHFLFFICIYISVKHLSQGSVGSSGSRQPAACEGLQGLLQLWEASGAPPAGPLSQIRQLQAVRLYRLLCTLCCAELVTPRGRPGTPQEQGRHCASCAQSSAW